MEGHQSLRKRFIISERFRPTELKKKGMMGGKSVWLIASKASPKANRSSRELEHKHEQDVDGNEAGWCLEWRGCDQTCVVCTWKEIPPS